MKLLLLLLPFGFLHFTESKLVLIDRQMKLPAVRAEQITFEQYRNRSFPIYEKDLAAVIVAAEAVAKKLRQKIACYQPDTVVANHTQFIIYASCETYNSVSVSVQTNIGKQNLFCTFNLVHDERNYRKIQRALLDFSDYLAETIEDFSVGSTALKQR